MNYKKLSRILDSKNNGWSWANHMVNIFNKEGILTSHDIISNSDFEVVYSRNYADGRRSSDEEWREETNKVKEFIRNELIPSPNVRVYPDKIRIFTKPTSEITDSEKLKKYDKGLIRRYLEERDFYEPLDLSNGMKFECILNDYGFKLYAVEVVPGETVWDDKEIRHLVWNTGDSLEDMDIDELAQACYDMIQSGNYLEED